MHNMAFVLADRQILVHEYCYRMNGAISGTLYLLDAPNQNKMISWKSACTGLRTLWHGGWCRLWPADYYAHGLLIHREEEGFMLTFDHIGRPTNDKWARVHRDSPSSSRYTGQDYRRRHIMMTHERTWAFDVTVGAFITAQHGW